MRLKGTIIGQQIDGPRCAALLLAAFAAAALPPDARSQAAPPEPLVLRASPALGTAESPGAARAAAAQAWQVLGATPDQQIQLHTRTVNEAHAAREAQLRSEAALAATREALDRHKRWAWVPAGMLAAIGILAFLWMAMPWRRRESPDTFPEPPDTEPRYRPSVGTVAPRTAPAPAPKPPATVPPTTIPPAKPPAAPPAPLPALSAPLSIRAEELIDVYQQVEFFISLGMPQQAIELLEQHILDDAASTPLAWLYLLDLYHSGGNRTRFETMREEFCSRFNVEVAPYDQYGHESAGLERYSRALTRITALWRQPRVLSVLGHSLFRSTTAEGERAFELEAYRDLLMLYRVAEDLLKGEGHAHGEVVTEDTEGASTRMQQLPVGIDSVPQAPGGLPLPDVDLGRIRSPSGRPRA